MLFAYIIGVLNTAYLDRPHRGSCSVYTQNSQQHICHLDNRVKRESICNDVQEK